MNKHFFYVSKKTDSLFVKSLFFAKILIMLSLAFFTNDSSFKSTFQSIEENIKETIMGDDSAWTIQLASLDSTLDHFDVLGQVGPSSASASSSFSN